MNIFNISPIGDKTFYISMFLEQDNLDIINTKFKLHKMIKDRKVPQELLCWEIGDDISVTNFSGASQYLFLVNHTVQTYRPSKDRGVQNSFIKIQLRHHFPHGIVISYKIGRDGI